MKKRCPAGLRGEKEPVRPEKREKTGLGKKKELMRPAESEKIEEIREKEVPCGSERGKRGRETRSGLLLSLDLCYFEKGGASYEVGYCLINFHGCSPFLLQYISDRHLS